MTQRSLQTILLAAALLSLAAAMVLAIDLYAGIAGKGFALVRGAPVSASDGFRYHLLLTGESTSVLLMLFCAGLMFKLRRQLGKQGRSSRG